MVTTASQSQDVTDDLLKPAAQSPQEAERRSASGKQPAQLVNGHSRATLPVAEKVLTKAPPIIRPTGLRMLALGARMRPGRATFLMVIVLAEAAFQRREGAKGMREARPTSLMLTSSLPVTSMIMVASARTLLMSTLLALERSSELILKVSTPLL